MRPAAWVGAKWAALWPTVHEMCGGYSRYSGGFRGHRGQFVLTAVSYVTLQPHGAFREDVGSSIMAEEQWKTWLDYIFAQRKSWLDLF